MRREIQELTITDDVTGLFNRAIFTRRWRPRSIARLALATKLASSLSDLDHFKQVNDTRTSCGDRLLAEWDT